MGVTALCAAGAALLLAAPGAAPAVRYLESRELASGGFAEPGRQATAGLTAWAVLGLRAAGARPSAATREYLARADPETPTESALVVMARAAAGADVDGGALRLLARPNGAIGPTVNSTAWSVLALRQLGETVPPATVRYLLRRQSRTGGWSWAAGIAPDSNDTAAVVQALRSVGVRGGPIRRALAFLRAYQNRNGGFALVRGRASDTQSTAWAIQAFLAANARIPRGAFAYLARMRRGDGSYRYSARYVTTPVWVTSQVLPALARRPFPLRASSTWRRAGSRARG